MRPTLRMSQTTNYSTSAAIFILYASGKFSISDFKLFINSAEAASLPCG